MAFSGYKNQRRRTGTRLERGRGENKQTFIPLFLLKETEEVKEKSNKQEEKRAKLGGKGERRQRE
jgi:hypothetical protein